MKRQEEEGVYIYVFTIMKPEGMHLKYTPTPTEAMMVQLTWNPKVYTVLGFCSVDMNTGSFFDTTTDMYRCMHVCILVSLCVVVSKKLPPPFGG